MLQKVISLSLSLSLSVVSFVYFCFLFSIVRWADLLNASLFIDSMAQMFRRVNLHSILRPPVHSVYVHTIIPMQIGEKEIQDYYEFEGCASLLGFNIPASLRNKEYYWCDRMRYHYPHYPIRSLGNGAIFLGSTR